MYLIMLPTLLQMFTNAVELIYQRWLP